MRIAWLFFFVGILAAPTVSATCEYRPEWRGTDTASYVADARVCLEELKDGFWVDEAVEEEVFDRVNAARRDAGLEPLELREGLLPAARLHSFDMGQDWFFDHKGPDGRSVSDRVAALDRRLMHSEVRENIAQIKGDFDWSETGEILHNILFNSDGHRENMLAPRLTHMAMGIVRTEDGAWITQVFVRKEGELERDAPLSTPASLSVLPAARLSDWAYRETRLLAGEEELAVGGKPSDYRGDGQVLVVGTRPIDELQYEIINLIGPSVTVTD
ncbi:MAG: CAP domain-containing protein [Pseudomonadota bacterium]